MEPCLDEAAQLARAFEQNKMLVFRIWGPEGADRVPCRGPVGLELFQRNFPVASDEMTP